ncbi:delta 5 fatty acid desaturase [Yasminevirus sp. GU-2018]|uniref:Delta 5 fatty acid desaturase n=1 Tax=Yasminevirus sp. GU-2018 TaxID=2420051 RepID=A0A5K0U9N2_9VIRU|nr:delta 5 fatty acid desaturase [Yasminevirus sp. GU-2018]
MFTYLLDPFVVIFAVYSLIYWLFVDHTPKKLDDDHFVMFEGSVYNLKNFNHPGGNEIIRTFSGRDVTLLVHSYHMNVKNVRSLLTKYKITDPDELAKADEILKPNKLNVTFDSYDSSCYDAMKQRVVKETNKDWMMDWTMVLKFVVCAFGYILGWRNIILSKSVISILFWVLVSAICHNMIDMNVMHDGSHYALSKNKYIRKFGVMVGYIMGGPVGFFWLYGHALYHHTLTGVEDLDPELQLMYPILRTYQYQKRYWFHRFQTFYAPFMYIHAGLALLLGDILSFIRKEITSLINPVTSQGHLTLKTPQESREIYFYASTKIMFFIMWLLVPMCVHGVLMGSIMCYLFIVLTGIMVLSQFGIGHVVETDLSNSDTETSLENSKGHFRDIDEWTDHQIRHTADFNSENFVVTNLTGGINNQILHHLFPGVAHRCFPKLIKIVKDHCTERKVPYNDKPFIDQWRSHFSRLNRLGRED